MCLVHLGTDAVSIQHSSLTADSLGKDMLFSKGSKRVNEWVRLAMWDSASGRKGVDRRVCMNARERMQMTQERASQCEAFFSLCIPLSDFPLDPI